MFGEIPFFIIALIFVGPTLISSIWTTNRQTKFFQLLERKKQNKADNLLPQFNTINPFQQAAAIRKMNVALNAQYRDKELNQAAQNAQKAYYTTIIILIISTALTFFLVLTEN